jgi:hypothetical protein
MRLIIIIKKAAKEIALLKVKIGSLAIVFIKKALNKLQRTKLKKPLIMPNPTPNQPNAIEYIITPNNKPKHKIIIIINFSLGNANNDRYLPASCSVKSNTISP